MTPLLRATAWALAIGLAAAGSLGQTGDVPEPPPQGGWPADHVVGAASPRCDRCGIVVVSLDTLRPDHLGCYGYDRPTSPELDELCRDAVVFESAYAAAPSTTPSHASLFTSLLPRQHGASFDAARALPASALTLAEILSSEGYATAGFVDGGQVSPRYGFDQGFDRYVSRARRDLDGNVEEAMAWLDGRPSDRPFFLFLQTYEIHVPYRPEAEALEALGHSYTGPLPRVVKFPLLTAINQGDFVVDRRDVEHIVSLYDAGIRGVDAALGRLLRELRARDRYDSTLLVVLSDHGEEFGDHGTVAMHSHTLYDELLRVPLVVKLPASAYAASRVRRPVGLVDLLPTVLDTVGAGPAPSGIRGRSLLPLLEGSGAGSATGAGPPDRASRWWARPIVSEKELGLDSRAVRAGRWKLYDGRLFDLLVDPEERYDVADAHPGAVAALREILERTASRPGLPGTPAEVDEQLREDLRTLGYIE